MSTNFTCGLEYGASLPWVLQTPHEARMPSPTASGIRASLSVMVCR